MAEICPFPGVLYNQEIVGDLASIICPPYDVISPEDQKAYYEKSEYNIVRLEHGMVFPGDNANDNKYTRAKAIFNQWLHDRVLGVNHVPSFYIHEHVFTYQNIRKRRLALIACVRLEPWEKRIILPHEDTMPVIKSDRLDLMRACAANFSPLFGLYEDPGLRVTKLLTSQTSRKPVIDFTDSGETHRLWIANEPEFVQRVSHFLASKPIYIADGHHRYETALTYRDERLKSALSVTGEEAFNFVMMALVSFSDPGLVVLPVHRLLQGISLETLLEFKTYLGTLFEMKSIPLEGDILIKGVTAMVLGLELGRVTALSLRCSESLLKDMPQNRSQAYKRLEVSIVQHLLIDWLVARDEKVTIAYSPNLTQVLKLVESGQYQLAFLLNPIPVSTIKMIADAGDRMPGKSTFFYPKLPTGLVINRLEGKLL